MNPGSEASLYLPMSTRHRVVLRNAPGYRHPPLDLVPLGVVEDDIALAVTIPHWNMIAGIDVGYRRGDACFPWEETLHYVTILSTKNGMYSIVSEGVKKALDNDFSDTSQELEKTVPLAEAIAEIREEYDPEYRAEMSRYRAAVLGYLGTDQQEIFSRKNGLFDPLESEKEALHEAANNIIRLFDGPSTDKFRTSMLALTIYAASSYPDHKDFLESCATLNKKWKSILGPEDFFNSLPDDLQQEMPLFPLDHFHYSVLETMEIALNVMEHYTDFANKIGLLSFALPPMLSAIDFATGFFVFSDLMMRPEISSSGKSGVRCWLRPRLHVIYNDFSFVQQMIHNYAKTFDCPLAKAYDWTLNPTQAADAIFNSIGGKTGASKITAYYLNRSFNLLELMNAVEETLVLRKSKCPHCNGLIETLEKSAPELAHVLFNRYITKNYPQLFSTFEQAASNVSNVMSNYWKRLAYKYVIDLGLC